MTSLGVLTAWNCSYVEWLWSDMFHKVWFWLLVWGTSLNITLIISVATVHCRFSDKVVFFKHTKFNICCLKNCYWIIAVNWSKVWFCITCVYMFAVGLHSLSTSPDTISWLSDFLFYNVPSLFIEPRLLKRQTNAARNTGLPLQLLLHPPFHCLGCCTLVEQTGSSPHGGVMGLNH